MQAVVQLDRRRGRQNVCPHVMFSQQSKGFRANLKSAQNALRQDDRGSAMIKQLGDVGGLYAWLVSGCGLVPIPLPRSARENLGVPKCSKTLDLDATPSKRHDTRRSSSAVGRSQCCQGAWHGVDQRIQTLCPGQARMTNVQVSHLRLARH